jgi:ribosome-associated protein
LRNAYAKQFLGISGKAKAIACVTISAAVLYFIVPEVGEARILEGIEIARRAVNAASDKQAGDIVLLDTRKVCSFADYFVICTAESERQIRAIYEDVEQSLKKEGVLPIHHEGTVDSGWLLLDYGDVIVHIFSTAEREFYQLDRLWGQADLVLRIH